MKRFLLALALAAGLAGTARAETVCSLVAELESGAAVAQTGLGCLERNAPASTFKVALSLMGFDAGVLIDAHNPSWPYREEYDAGRSAWKVTTDPMAWMGESVVWFSQVLTRTLGEDAFAAYVQSFGYGNGDVSGDPGQDNGLTRAWLDSSLAISPAEQVAFLRLMLTRNLPVTAHATDMTIAVMPRFALRNGWVVQGKTGTGYQRLPTGRLDRTRQYGWFVGWASRGGETLVFARLDRDERRESEPAGFRARDAMLAELEGILAGR